MLTKKDTKKDSHLQTWMNSMNSRFTSVHLAEWYVCCWTRHVEFSTLSDIKLYTNMPHTSGKEGGHHLGVGSSDVHTWWRLTLHRLLLSMTCWPSILVGLLGIRANALSSCWWLSVFSVLRCYKSVSIFWSHINFAYGNDSSVKYDYEYAVH